MSADLGLAIRSILLADANVVAITNRIYADRMPQSGQAPCVVFSTIYGAAVDCIDGPTGFMQSTVQFECYGNTRAEASQVWGVMNLALCGYRGTVTISGSDDVVIRAVAQASAIRHRDDRPITGTDQYRFANVQDLQFSYHVYEKV